MKLFIVAISVIGIFSISNNATANHPEVSRHFASQLKSSFPTQSNTKVDFKAISKLELIKIQETLTSHYKKINLIPLDNLDKPENISPTDQMNNLYIFKDANFLEVQQLKLVRFEELGSISQYIVLEYLVYTRSYQIRVKYPNTKNREVTFFRRKKDDYTHKIGARFKRSIDGKLEFIGEFFISKIK